MAANEKKATIVIKKITVQAAGGHGGSWKVAFADFMTAMMAFFLVMWLVNQSEEVKKSVADYFSTPSIIEYNFSNYGVELTLEKLFNDLMNEPLKAFEQFIMPVDKKPNLMDMGTKKIQIHYLAEKIGDFAENETISTDEITFDIPDEYLFKRNSAEPAGQYVQIMENIRSLLEGLQDVNVYIHSELPYRGSITAASARNIAEERLDLILHKVEQGEIKESVDFFGKSSVEKYTPTQEKRDRRGYIKFKIRQKDRPKVKGESKTVARPGAGEVAPGEEQDIYNDFLKKMTEKAEGKSN